VENQSLCAAKCCSQLVVVVIAVVGQKVAWVFEGWGRGFTSPSAFRCVAIDSKATPRSPAEGRESPSPSLKHPGFFEALMRATLGYAQYMVTDVATEVDARPISQRHS
jgi:hypothetical protein